MSRLNHRRLQSDSQKIRAFLTCLAVYPIFFVLMFSTGASAAKPVIIKQQVLKNLPLTTIKKDPSLLQKDWPEVEFNFLVMEKHGDTWKWAAIVKNNGSILPAAQVRVRATQLGASGHPIGPAGVSFVYKQAVAPGGIMNFGQQGWQRAPFTTYLKVDIENLNAGRVKTRIIRMPDTGQWK